MALQYISPQLAADPIPVREKQGAMYGFLVLKSADGKIIAVGDEINTVDGNRIRSRATFRFRDGSIDDELAVFKQGTAFELISDHHVQRGPSFKEPLDMSVDIASKTVTWRDNKHQQQRRVEHMELPDDLANGITSLIVENFPSNASKMTVSYLAGASKPRMVKLVTTPDGSDTFRVGGFSRPAKKYRIHVDIGGLTGLIAPLLGKQPPDIEMWVTAGEVATFLKMEGPLYEDGPIWTLELAAPGWSGTTH